MFPGSFPSISAMAVLPIVVILVCLQEVSSALFYSAILANLSDTNILRFKSQLLLGVGYPWVAVDGCVFLIELCSTCCQCTEMHLISVS